MKTKLLVFLLLLTKLQFSQVLLKPDSNLFKNRNFSIKIVEAYDTRPYTNKSIGRNLVSKNNYVISSEISKFYLDYLNNKSISFTDSVVEVAVFIDVFKLFNVWGYARGYSKFSYYIKEAEKYWYIGEGMYRLSFDSGNDIRTIEHSLQYMLFQSMFDLNSKIVSKDFDKKSMTTLQQILDEKKARNNPDNRTSVKNRKDGIYLSYDDFINNKSLPLDTNISFVCSGDDDYLYYMKKSRNYEYTESDKTFLFVKTNDSAYFRLGKKKFTLVKDNSGIKIYNYHFIDVESSGLTGGVFAAGLAFGIPGVLVASLIAGASENSNSSGSTKAIIDFEMGEILPDF